MAFGVLAKIGISFVFSSQYLNTNAFFSSVAILL